MRVIEEIINKIDTVRSVGRPVSVMVTQELYDLMVEHHKKSIRCDRGVFDQAPTTICGLPIKIKEPTHIWYSIEVAWY